ncbi:MAG: aldo/keto reductase [Candidatus Sumerlaeaceae bacterium]|nr:aldo/keto reductase [Candidatus Sumerlaeaceae bacterium]
MTSEEKGVSRRGFMAGAGIAALGTMMVAAGSSAAEETTGTAAPSPAIPQGAKVATRPFGRTGRNVSILSMGGMYDIPNNQMMLRKCLDWGVTYWDTANGYGGGKSEEGIGMFFEKFPQERKNVFLVTKTGARDAKGMTDHLELSLKRMKTDYVDLIFAHGINGINEVGGPEIKAWAEKAKKDGKIKFFGFSTHKNMEDLLAAAPALGYIDGIMLTYNYRIMHGDAMKRGVEACTKAGIGLTAMKTQGGGPVSTASEEEIKLAGRFLQKGMTPHQAKLKAIWENEQIAAVCSQMPNLTILTANTSAALSSNKLTAGDWRALKSYAEATSSSYCAGCAKFCEAGDGCDALIADVMRFMMYHTSYGDTHHARQCFAEMPEMARESLRRLDWERIARACPRGLPMGDVVREALKALA